MTFKHSRCLVAVLAIILCGRNSGSSPDLDREGHRRHG